MAELPPDSEELGALLAGDPAPEVRIAAAGRCGDLSALASAWQNESDPAVRAALATALGGVLAETQDGEKAAAVLGAEGCTDGIRADVARRTTIAERRRSAIATLREEASLVELALTAEHAETRMMAAERVQAPEALRKLADTAGEKDRGVARLARKRIDAREERDSRSAQADALIAQLEALAVKPGPILMAVIELNRRWQALDLSDDPERLARCDAARRTLQERFDREHEEQRARTRFEQRLSDWLGRIEPPATAEALADLRNDLAALREDARKYADAVATSWLDDAAQRVERWTLEREALAGAEALVIEAEQLAAGTSIDNAKLPERWQVLDRSIRTPALTRRFEAALIVIEQRRLAQVRAAEEESRAARAQVHSLLHTAEQALAAGQLHAARAATDEIRAWRPSAGALPKPTTQRLGRLTQELTELERWESFGQRQARMQLCERAEAAAALTLEAPRLAVEVQALRNEWKALDQQHAGVPRSLWERFDRACEKAYAPAARFFAEQAAQRKQARKQRDEFVALAAAHAPTLLVEPCDWRAIERWLRETDQRWHGGELGSVEPKVWKSLDAQLKAALGPVRAALSEVRDQAKARRLELIEEVAALAANATDRDAPAKVKAVQAKWQAQAKEMTLVQRDERELWERFRTACDAVFQTREAKRKQEDDRRHEGRRALEDICAQLEQLAAATDREESDLRRLSRDLQEQWRQQSRASKQPVPRGIESRFANAKATLEGALAARGRARAAAVWQTLAAKERLCEQLDALLHSGGAPGDAAPAVEAQWAALPALPPAWEKALLGRRAAALHALADEGAAATHRIRIDQGAQSRREMLLALEMLLGLESPPELKAERLALQIKQLRDRFQGAASGPGSAGDRLVAWCAQSGVLDPSDRGRCERVFTAVERAR